jgi:hypothetical protein
MTEQPDYNADFRDMIAALLGAEARFVVPRRSSWTVVRVRPAGC